MKEHISPRVRSLMIASGMFSGTMNLTPTYDEFAELLIRDCINTACLAELEGKNISKTMMETYFMREKSTYLIKGYSKGELMFEESYIAEEEVDELVQQFEAEGYACEVEEQ